MGRQMARSINILSARKVETLIKPGLHGDGGGLYLQVKSKTAKSWIFRFTFRGKRRDMGLGSLNSLPLRDAREIAGKCRLLLRNGVNPIEERNAEKARENVTTFQQCAEDYIEDKKSG